MFCGNCGNQIDDANSKFCGSCGQAITSVAPSSSPTPSQTVYVNTAQTIPQSVYSSSHQQSVQMVASPITVPSFSDALAWVIALIPILSVALKSFVLFMLIFVFKVSLFRLISIGTYIGLVLGIACLAINIVLCYYDEKLLKAQGYNINVASRQWLIPLYLYHRSIALRKGIGCTVTWCILFVIVEFILPFIVG